jgi:hypothetical protein
MRGVMKGVSHEGGRMKGVGPSLFPLIGTVTSGSLLQAPHPPPTDDETATRLLIVATSRLNR